MRIPLTRREGWSIFFGVVGLVAVVQIRARRPKFTREHQAARRMIQVTEARLGVSVFPTNKRKDVTQASGEQSRKRDPISPVVGGVLTFPECQDLPHSQNPQR